MYYLLRKHLVAAGATVPILREKRIHPHSLRHTTALSLLKSGVDFPTISQWLGHASLDTTMRYAQSDIDMKRQALLQVFPDILSKVSADRGTFRTLADYRLVEAALILMWSSNHGCRLSLCLDPPDST
ncbi:tyrosine-type recombinase/integrase [Paraburkholderia guartelaensis]|uniref:Tyrosine-type recombinase/integrase n=1 Tax=Paraburkholderia guartelaensis TaxID=2546446 RepID=A0ABU9SQ06_9BURK